MVNRKGELNKRAVDTGWPYLARDTMWFTTSVGAYLGAIFAISPNTVAEVLSCERHAVCIRDKQWNLEPESRLRLW